MSKGLKELNKIKKLDILYDIEMTENGEEYMNERNINLDIIEKELKEYELLGDEFQSFIGKYNKLCKEKMEWLKQKEALEIIKNKRVDCYAVVESKSLIDMNERFWFPSEEWKLTQEEYDLLKEVLL